MELIGFIDSYYPRDRDKIKPISSSIFTLYGNCICWKTQLQSVVALSTTEAEYIAAKEAVWLKGILTEFNVLC